MVEELVKDGHLIGNHSYHHVQLNKLSIEEATGEIEKTNRLIREWTGEAPVYIRPPYGAWSQELEKVVDMIPVFWNVDSLDWKLQNKEQVLSCLSGQVKEGDVILMQMCIRDRYTSGTVFHAFLGEKLPDWKAAATLVRKIAENYRLPYYTLSPTYSVCKEHGYIAGEHFTCPTCGTVSYTHLKQLQETTKK